MASDENYIAKITLDYVVKASQNLMTLKLQITAKISAILFRYNQAKKTSSVLEQ